MTHRRRLRPEEQELWQAVSRTAKPLHPVLARQPIMNLPAALIQTAAAVHPAPAFGRFRIGEKAPAHAILPPLNDRLAAAPLRMDAKALPAWRAASCCLRRGSICMALAWPRPTPSSPYSS